MKIHKMFDKSLLQKTCNTNEWYFTQYGSVQHTLDGRYYIYKDNGSNILGVAHLDTVGVSKKFSLKNWVVKSPNLDDRLGVYVLLHVLPKYNIKFDLLLTVGEESGQSSARFFMPPLRKKYNWIFEFDRRLDDVVMYQFDNDYNRNLLRRTGFTRIELGSFSDIAYLDNLGCSGFNFGVGYDMEHTAYCYADLYMTKNIVEKFITFYHTYKKTLIPYDYTFESYQDYIGSKYTNKVIYDSKGRKTSYDPYKYNKQWYKDNDVKDYQGIDDLDDLDEVIETEAIDLDDSWWGVTCPLCGFNAEDEEEAREIEINGSCTYCKPWREPKRMIPKF